LLIIWPGFWNLFTLASLGAFLSDFTPQIDFSQENLGKLWKIMENLGK
jgi:hypothetical protein